MFKKVLNIEIDTSSQKHRCFDILMFFNSCLKSMLKGLFSTLITGGKRWGKIFWCKIARNKAKNDILESIIRLAITFSSSYAPRALKNRFFSQFLVESTHCSMFDVFPTSTSIYRCSKSTRCFRYIVQITSMFSNIDVDVASLALPINCRIFIAILQHNHARDQKSEATTGFIGLFFLGNPRKNKSNIIPH